MMRANNYFVRTFFPSRVVFERFPASITDQVFLLIQNDHELMYEYLRLVDETKLNSVNQQIGKAVKKHFKLDNSPDRGTSRNSTWIKSFQIFEE